MSVAIDQTLVRRIAALARLDLSDDEVRLYAGQLTNILAYIKQIELLDTNGVEPLAHAVPLTDVLREDRTRPSLTAQQVLANAPDTQCDCFHVPAIFDSCMESEIDS